MGLGHPPEPAPHEADINEGPQSTRKLSCAEVKTFGKEDDSRVRHRTAARNLALLRKIALNLVTADRSRQTSLRGRRKKAAWNDDYMLRIITRQVDA